MNDLYQKITLQKVLTEVLEVMELMDGNGERARHFTNVPEDPEVKALCERIGYGAVMDSAARQWFKKDSTGSFVSGPCAFTVRETTEMVRKALDDLKSSQ